MEPDGYMALRGVSLDASAGTLMTIAGPDRAGNTTQFNAMAGLLSIGREGERPLSRRAGKVLCSLISPRSAASAVYIKQLKLPVYYCSGAVHNLKAPIQSNTN